MPDARDPHPPPDGTPSADPSADRGAAGGVAARAEAGAEDQMDLPLRGLASTGADAIVGPPLRALPGVQRVEVHAEAFRVRVRFDPARVSRATIRETLHGIAAPDTAHGARTPTGPHQAPGRGPAAPG